MSDRALALSGFVVRFKAVDPAVLDAPVGGISRRKVEDASAADGWASLSVQR